MLNTKNPSSLVDSSILVQKHLTLLEGFKILLGYIFSILFIQSLVLFIFLSIARVFPTGNSIQIAMIGNLLARFLGLVSAAYFTFLMIRRYFPAPTTYISFSQIGLMRCSNKSVALAVILGVVFVIVFEYWLPRRYPADPIVLEKLRVQLGEDSVLRTIFSLLITVGITPVVEEVFFRGFLHKVFSVRLGKVASASIVTIIFVSLHYQAFSYWVALVSLLTGSIVLVVMRETSASLIPSILLHQIYNLGVAVFSK